MCRALTLSALILSATPLFAHHNIAAMYDAEKPVPLNGTVSAVQWRNPHVFVFVDAKDETGTIINWKVEWLAGLDTISMTVCVAKDGSHNAAAQFIFVPTALENHRAGVCKAVSR